MPSELRLWRNTAINKTSLFFHIREETASSLSPNVLLVSADKRLTSPPVLESCTPLGSVWELRTKVMKDLYVWGPYIRGADVRHPISPSKRARSSRLFGGLISAPPTSHYSQGGFLMVSILQKGRTCYP